MPDPLHQPPRSPNRWSRPRLLDISLPQVIGGALAAMTAAALGSRLGVAGTVTGAAVASVVATLGGALYTGSLRRTHAGARTLWSRLRATDSDRGPVDATPPPDAPSMAPGHTADAASAGVAPGPATVIIRPARRVHPLGILVGAAATMVVALAGLTGAELAAGHDLTGGQHTTIERIVVRYVTAPDKTTPPDAATPTGAPSSTPDNLPSGTPTDPTPSESPSSAPSATASDGTAPSKEPTGSATGSQSQTSQPDATASPHATTPRASGSGSDATQSLQALQR